MTASDARTAAKRGRVVSRGLKCLSALCGLLIVSGCATTRYVNIYCATPGQVQKLQKAEPPKVGDKLTGQAQNDLKIIAGSAVQLREYSHGLLGVIGGCVDPNK